MKKIWIKSFLAGFLIGLGVIANTMVAPPVLGATLFSFGLLTILYFQFYLYTGKIGFIKIKNIPKLINIFCWNGLGILTCIILYIFAHPEFYNLLLKAAENKFIDTKNPIQFLYCGIFCGVLIHFAVKAKHILLTTMAIVIFILIGAEHCIADIPYVMILPFSWNNLLNWFLIIIGNSAGAIAIEKLMDKE